MGQFDYDLLVIGAGSGGVRASRLAASAGARVAVVEASALGGTCVNRGCVPKKLLVYGAHFSELFHRAGGFGWHPGAVRFQWHELRDNTLREVERLNGVYARLLQTAGVELIAGHGRLLDGHRVAVAGRVYSAERILLAVGGAPWVPDFPGREWVITSDQAFHLERLPERMVVVGGGYIAVEFASIFNGLGVETHLCYRGDLFLRGFDQDVRQFVAEQLRHQGIRLHFNTRITRIDRRADGDLQVQASDGRDWQVGQVLYATGRRPLSEDLGLENTAIVPDERGHVRVNEHYQTAEPSVFALGDMTGGVALTPVALAEASAWVNHWYRGGSAALDYTRIPTAVFCQPSIASVGLSETAAREQLGEVRVYVSRFRPLALALAESVEQSLVKLVVEAATERVVGCHMVGPEAGEIIQGLAVALKAGATKTDFDSTLGVHPTLAEEFVTLRQERDGP